MKKGEKDENEKIPDVRKCCSGLLLHPFSGGIFVVVKMKRWQATVWQVRVTNDGGGSVCLLNAVCIGDIDFGDGSGSGSDAQHLLCRWQCAAKHYQMIYCFWLKWKADAVQATEQGLLINQRTAEVNTLRVLLQSQNTDIVHNVANQLSQQKEINRGGQSMAFHQQLTTLTSNERTKSRKKWTFAYLFATYLLDTSHHHLP